MIKHIVMWKLAETAENQTKIENAQKIKDMLEFLQEIIPEISKIEVGINFSQSEAAYDVVLYSEFKTVDDMNTYQEHPEHKKVSAFITKVRTDRIVADYMVD